MRRKRKDSSLEGKGVARVVRGIFVIGSAIKTGARMFPLSFRRASLIAASAVLVVVSVVLVRGVRWTSLKGQTTPTYSDGYNEVLLDTDPNYASCGWGYNTCTQHCVQFCYPACGPDQTMNCGGCWWMVQERPEGDRIDISFPSVERFPQLKDVYTCHSPSVFSRGDSCYFGWDQDRRAKDGLCWCGNGWRDGEECDEGDLDYPGTTQCTGPIRYAMPGDPAPPPWTSQDSQGHRCNTNDGPYEDIGCWKDCHLPCCWIPELEEATPDDGGSSSSDMSSYAQQPSPKAPATPWPFFAQLLAWFHRSPTPTPTLAPSSLVAAEGDNPAGQGCNQRLPDGTKCTGVCQGNCPNGYVCRKESPSVANSKLVCKPLRPTCTSGVNGQDPVTGGLASCACTTSADCYDNYETDGSYTPPNQQMTGDPGNDSGVVICCYKAATG